MENILQSIVKIIIVGCLYECRIADGNRQFPPPPPLPYYQNRDYIPPGYALPYQEPLPGYYQDESAPPPTSFHNMNSYTPPQLFHRNENYDSLQAANPGGIYPPQILPYKPGIYQPYPQDRVNVGIPQVNYKIPPAQTGLRDRPAEVTPKKPAFYATNIVVKEESQPPYYQDDYGKNYHEEDYNDNYSDDISSPSEPCLNSPYRYFEPTNNFNNKYNLCNPYFQPDFGNGVYTVKMPVTLLPSRFPPRVEELIERIQNYFSTYTQQQTPKPQNQTSTTTTVQPVTEAVTSATESEAHSTMVMGAHNKKNTTVEIEELSLEHGNGELPEATTVEMANDLERATQKTIVIEVEKMETSERIASAPDAEAKKESQGPEQGTQSPSERKQNPTTTEFSVDHQENSKANATLQALQATSPKENQIVKEWNQKSQPEGPVSQANHVEGSRSTTESAEVRKDSEKTSTIQPVIPVTDNTS